MKEKKPPVEAALKIIARKRVSKNELSAKMRSKGYSDEEIEYAKSYLTELHYLNDDELLSDYIKYLSEKKMYGPEKIVSFLKKKGFAARDIREKIYQLLSEDTLIKNASLLIGKKLKGKDLSDKENREKAIRTLSYNGYDWDLIERVINR
ncbi:MAG: recombination regulator RecX [Deltaproteobacteria bacterium]|nr:recombination regulator RecX [Deltaproteobacteria bacterium]